MAGRNFFWVNPSPVSYLWSLSPLAPCSRLRSFSLSKHILSLLPEPYVITRLESWFISSRHWLGRGDCGTRLMGSTPLSQRSKVQSEKGKRESGCIPCVKWLSWTRDQDLLPPLTSHLTIPVWLNPKRQYGWHGAFLPCGQHDLLKSGATPECSARCKH